LAGTLNADEDRTANVVIVNRTSKTLATVSVAHHYGCEWKISKTFKNLRPRAATPDFEVKYRTGITTTGVDWWLVSWEPEGSDFVYFTDPENFRWFVDAIEGPAAKLAGLTVTAVASFFGIDPTVAGAAGIITQQALRPECGTKGFKQHTLRTDDEKGNGRRTFINIYDKKVQWSSESGVSDTVDIASRAKGGAIEAPGLPVAASEPLADGDDMQAREILRPDWHITSSNGKYRLIYQLDGNLVLYRRDQALWTSNTSGKSVGKCVMQGDGNLVVYDASGTAVWNSGTLQAGNRLLVQNDGNLVIYRPDGKTAVWASNTRQP
jgi:hypothetical protein